MKIGIISDVHLEFWAGELRRQIAQKLASTPCDTLVVAGDLTTVQHLKTSIEDLIRPYRYTIYVVGNHEFYGANNTNDVYKILKELEEQHDTFYWLHNNVCEIEDRIFAGSPLWFHYDESKDQADSVYLNDFYQIPNFVPFVQSENALAQKFLKEVKADVVITHHLPSQKYVSPKYKDNKLNKFFVCPVLDNGVQHPPPIWIHGHTHDKVDVMYGNTRVVANPMGYPKEIDPDYQPLIIEV